MQVERKKLEKQLIKSVYKKEEYEKDDFAVYNDARTEEYR